MADGLLNLTKKIEEAERQESGDSIGNAIRLYEEVINAPLKTEEITEDNVKAKEAATYRLAQIYKDKGLVDELIAL